MSNLDLKDCINRTCPWSGKPVAGDSLTTYRDHVVGFCNTGCRDKFETATTQLDKTIEDAAAGRARPGP